MRTSEVERPGRALLALLGGFLAYVAALVALGYLGSWLLPGDDPLHLRTSLLLAELVGGWVFGGRLADVLVRLAERVAR